MVAQVFIPSVGRQISMRSREAWPTKQVLSQSMIYSELSQNKTKFPKIPGFRDAKLSTFDLSTWESEASLVYIANSRLGVHSETMLHLKKGKKRERRKGK